MKRQPLALLCVLAAAAAATPARADAPPDDGAQDQLTLPKGRVVIDAFLTLGLYDNYKPFSISPDVWYGVTEDITVGLVHSSEGQTGFIGLTGTSLCLSGSDNLCPHVYQNVGLEGRYKLPSLLLAWALDGGLYFRDFDPVELGIKLGAVGRWHKGKLALEAEPALYLGLTNRDVDVAGVSFTQNGDHLMLPLSGFYAITPKVTAALQLGLDLPFEDTGDTWAVPFTIGVHYLATDKLNVNLSFTLTRLLGGSSADAFDGRSLTIGGSYAL